MAVESPVRAFISTKKLIASGYGPTRSGGSGTMQTNRIIYQTKAWVHQLVIGQNLCPFAAQPYRRDRIGFEVVPVLALEAHEERLLDACRRVSDPGQPVETILLIYPEEWRTFAHYLAFAERLNQVLDHGGWRGEIQLATFHPDYLFGGEDPKDASHYTNRSPYPMIHVLSESQLEDAIKHHPDPGAIPERNVARLREVGKDRLQHFQDDLRDLNQDQDWPDL